MWVLHIKHQIITPLTSNVNKKLQRPLTAALKKSDCRKSKRFWFSVLCYNYSKKEHIHFNCSHLSKNNAHWIQAVKAPDINSALKHLKNLKEPQWSEVLKSHHLNHKKWLFQLWLWFQKKVKNARSLLTMTQISILFIKVWWKSEESTLIGSWKGTFLSSMRRNYLIMIYTILRCMHITVINEWMSTADLFMLLRY